jgi:polar amino acid transport system substrate-binding protein
MRVGWIVAAAVSILLTGCATTQSSPTQEERLALTPTGKLRVAFLANQPIHATKDPATGEMKGVTIELSRELARRLDVPFEPVIYPTAVGMLSSAQSGQWDIIFTGIVPSRMKDMDFSAPYLQIEMSFLVRGDSPMSKAVDVDRAGVRIAVLQRGSSDELLTSTLKAATLIRNPTVADAVELLRMGRADAVAALKTFLYPASDKVPGSRVVEGGFGFEVIGIGVPKGRELSAQYVRRFVDDVKASGLVKAAVERAAQRGLLAAP